MTTPVRNVLNLPSFVEFIFIEINKTKYCKKLADILVSSVQNIHIWNYVIRPSVPNMLETLTVSEGNKSAR
jgi:hypothetical protein